MDQRVLMLPIDQSGHRSRARRGLLKSTNVAMIPVPSVRSVHALRDPVPDLAAKYAIQLGAHVCVQIAASGFD
jgi:hypothetical protein